MKPYFQRYQHSKISDLTQEVSDIAQEDGSIAQEMQISKSLLRCNTTVKSANQHRERFCDFDYAYGALFYA